MNRCNFRSQMFGEFDPGAPKYRRFDRYRGSAIIVIFAWYGAVYYAASNLEFEAPAVDGEVVAVALARSLSHQ